MKFMFKTLIMNSTTYDGPSGIRYTIYRGKPFEVNDSADIEFFSNSPRFDKVGMFKKAEVKDDIDILMKKELSGIKGLTQKTIEIMVESYISMDNLIKELEQGFEIKPILARRQKSILLKYLKKKYKL